MKRSYLHTQFILLSFLIGAGFLAACSGSEDKFTLNGKFTNLKEGELYFYTLTGDRQQMDTITIREGKFTYEAPQSQPGYYVLLFPNMSEQAIFVDKDLTIQLTADATHLKEMTIEGGPDNELMTAFRNEVKSLNTPQQIRPKAKVFIQKHPASQVSLYLLQRYFVQTNDATLEETEQLVNRLVKAQPQNIQLAALKRQIGGVKRTNKGAKAPTFSFRDSHGDTISLAQFKNKFLLLSFWASWHQESLQQQRDFKEKKKELGNKLASVSISLDVQRYAWRNILRFDSLPGKHACDMKAWESKVVKDYHITRIPTYILVNGTQQIVAREYDLESIKKKIDTLIK